MSEGSGIGVRDIAGQQLATFSQSAVWDAHGGSGRALYFNDAGVIPVVTPGIINAAGTIVAKIAVADVYNAGDHYPFYMPTSGNRRLRFTDYHSGAIHNFVCGYGASSAIDSNQDFVIGRWHQVAFSWIGLAYSVWFDGRLAVSGTVASCDAFTSACVIGGQAAPATAVFRGWMEFFSAYDRALTANEVAWLAAEPYCMILPPVPDHVWWFGSDTHLLEGSAASVSSTSAALTVHRALVGSTASASSTSADFTIYRPVIGSGASVSDLTGALSLTRNLVGAAASVSSDTGAITIYRPVVGGAASVSAATGNLIILKALRGSGASVSALAGAITVHRKFVGALASISALTGRLFDPTATVTIGSQGTLFHIENWPNIEKPLERTDLGVTEPMVQFSRELVDWQESLQRILDDALSEASSIITTPGGVGKHNILSASHLDSTVDSVVRGDLISGQGAIPTWKRLAKGAVGTILTMGADEPGWAAPVVGPHAILSATHTDSTAAAVTRGALITGQGASPKWTSLAKGTAGTILYAGADEPGYSTTDLTWTPGTSTLYAAILSAYNNLLFTGTSPIIRPTTSDGTDTALLSFYAGGGAGHTRGAEMQFTGNEYSANYRGTFAIYAGNPGTTGTYDGMFYVATGANTVRWLVDRAGNLVPAAASTYDIGSTTAEVANIFVGTGRAYFGAAQNASIYWDGTRLVLNVP
jgi:hypothetical protein